MSIILLLIAIGVTPETKAFLEMKQQQLKHNIVVDQAALDEIKRDGSLSTKDRTAQVNEASRRIAHLKLTRPDVPALRVPFVPFDADDVGTIKSLGKVKKVISDTSALIEFVGEETEIGSGRFTAPRHYSESIVAEEISRQTAVLGATALLVGATVKFTRIMEVSKDNDGKLVLRPWSAPAKMSKTVETSPGD